MATSIASQLQAIKSFVQVDSEPAKRPFTRPSVLFSPKEAADIDIDTIYSIALSGLEVLVNTDERFQNYKNDLFSHKSKELDRELLSTEENDRINASITSYLRLLSGYFQLLSSRRTLEYLIRRYKVHMYNMEELILCALPYHDTPAFVPVVQLINFGNTKWKFLDAVKASGAPPPRRVIVQHCMRDLGVLEALCNYASPTKKFQPSSPVISFCTAVVIEVVGSFVAVDSDVLKRIIPFVVSGLQPGAKGGLEQKASALMIVGLLANKAALSPKLVNSLIRSISEIARANAKDSTDLQWFRLVFMSLINLIQGQSVDLFPKKALEALKERGDIAGILLGLSKEFNVDKFLAVFLASMVDYSSLDDSFLLPLVSIIESVPIEHIVGSLITKILHTCLKLSQKAGNCSSPDLGIWAKKILVVVMKKYPSELHGAVKKFLETTRVQLGKEELVSDTLSKLLAGSQEVSLPLLDSKIWLSLHHPKAEVRRAALSGLNTPEILNARAVDSEGFETIQDALLRQLHDDDLTVVQAALLINNLSEIISHSNFEQALLTILQRCVNILLSSSTEDIALVGDIVILCSKYLLLRLDDSPKLSVELPALIFPLLLIMPKTWKCNLKALDVAKEVHWPLYQNLSSVAVPEKLQSGAMSTINLKIVNCLADGFMTNPQELMPWLVENSNGFMLSKALFLLVLMQSVMPNKKGNQSFDLLEACFHVLKTQWQTVCCSENIDVGQEIRELLEYDCTRFLDQLSDTNVKELNRKISICIFWRLLRTCTTDAPVEMFQGEYERWTGLLRELFSFFTLLNVNNIFSNHLYHLVNNCKESPPVFLSRFFTEEAVPVKVQMESLHCFAFLCSQSEDVLSLQLLAEFPSLLVPLASENQDVRTAAMSCIEVLYGLCSCVDLSGKKNGNIMIWSRFVDELLGLLVQQKRLILSDRNFLAALLTSLIGPPASGSSLLVPLNIENRFDESTKMEILNFILGSALKLSLYGKLIILSILKGMGSALLCVNEIELLLSLLFKRRSQYYFERDNSSKLSKTEVDILCLLLEICTMPASTRSCAFDDHLLKALQLKGISVEEPALVLPCITVLNNLNNQLFCGLNSETQERLFSELVILHRSDCGDIQKATTETLLRLDVAWSILVKMLDRVYQQEVRMINPKKQKKLKGYSSLNRQNHLISEGESLLPFFGSLLDICLMKKSVTNREYLVDPLFRLLAKLFLDDWLHGAVVPDQVDIHSGVSQIMSTTPYFIQQTLLLVLQDIITSTTDNQSMDVLREKVDIALLVKCTRCLKDGMTRNHIFSLLSTIAKVMPDRFLTHIEDVLHVLGEAAVSQIDGHSQCVFEELISSIVPCWLSKTNNMDQLLQIFVNILPEVAEHRRLSIITYLMRALGESDSLASLLFLLFQSLTTRKKLDELVNSTNSLLAIMTLMQAEWEYAFAVQICGHYSCVLWLPSLVILLEKISRGNSTNHLVLQLLLAIHFISYKLDDPEFTIMLDSMEVIDEIQGSLKELLQRVAPLWQLVDAREKHIALPAYLRKELKDCMHSVLVTITRAMIPLTYFKGMIKLLSYEDKDVRRKALAILSETMRYQDTIKPKRRGGESSMLPSRNWFHLDEQSLEACRSMCLDIVQLIDAPENESDIPLRLSAVSSIEALANRFPTEYSIFSVCLLSIAKGIGSSDKAFSSSCLRTSGTLINVLGPKALQNLPTLMEKLIKASRHVADNASAKSSSSRDFLLSVLTSLDAIVDKLGGFLNPYLENIIELLVLHSDLASGSDVKLTSKSRAIRKLVTEKIPVRLALPPLLKLYPLAVASGDSSLTIMFEMISSLVASMDRPSVSAYHAKIYDTCLQSLDLRRQHLASIKNICMAEKSIIDAIGALTMKLTETMFKPIFIRTIEWAESEVEETTEGDSRNVDRAISFYGLVNRLAENHRSLFVPYFKYLSESCVYHLTDSEQLPSSGSMPKKKKAKVLESSNGRKERNSGQSPKKWHLRALVLSALYKCFLYDTGSLRFLDSSTFQVLLKPIVSQLVNEPPARLEDFPDVPSLNEVDDLLVNCIGQMAVAAGSDLLWKPLNHEVLMQTRSEKVRSRLLALRVVKYLLEKLKEEYLVFLAETIPFLGELLEDVELPVKSLAQEILKEMESMSGESLRQYL